MANIPLQSITFPGLSDKYTTPTVDATLTQTGAAADAKKTGDELTGLKNDLNQLEAKVEDAYNAYVTETETGAIASFTDGADGVPVKDLSVAIEPVQDLHGYDNPWPGGGNGNLIDIATCTATGAGDIVNTTELSQSIPAGEYTVGITSSAAVAWILILTGSDDAEVGRFASNTSDAGRQTKTGTTTGTATKVRLYVNGATTLSSIMFESGSTAHDYVPYSNICPISGWTGANVNVSGKNLLAKPFDYSTNVPNTLASCFFIKAGTYTFSFGSMTATSWRVGVRMMDAEGNEMSDTAYAPQQYITWNTSHHCWLQGSNSTLTEMVFTFVADCYIRIIFAVGDTSASTTATGAMLEVGSTATAYEPYQGDTVSVDWTTEAGTVYGGTLDVTTGVLTVDRANIASYNGETLPSTWISDRDVYTSGATPTTGAQVVYALATPQTIQLTAHEVSTILGQNNIFADTGNVTVQYRADTKMYIDKVLSA